MKKITLITLSFVALLAMAGTAHAISACELEVTKGESYDPCVVINRVGIRNPFKKLSDKNVWIPVGPDMTKAECNERRDDPQDPEWNIDDGETYFKCGHQEKVRGCDLDTTISNISYLDQDQKHCWVGTHDGYETSLILFQVAHDYEDVETNINALTMGVASQRLSDSQGSADIDDTEKFKPIKTHVNKTITILLDRGEQLIASDGRAFWDIKDGCLGGACKKGNGKNPDGIAALVHDQILELSDPDAEGHIPFFNSSNFKEDRKVTILAPKDKPSVPISVDKNFDGDSVLQFRGATPASEPFSPRFIIRGWDVELNGSRRFMYTTGESKVVFARSRIEVKSGSVQAIFTSSADTSFNFSRGLEVNLDNQYVPVFAFQGMPEISTLAAMADGLTITFKPGGVPDEPVHISGAGSKTCTVVRKRGCTEDSPECLKCKEETLPVFGSFALYLVFEPICTDSSCTFDINLYKSPVHLPDSPDLPAPIVYALFEVVDGNLVPSGAKIEFDLSKIDEDHNFKVRGELEVHSPAPATIRPDWTIANDDSDEDEEDLECEDGFIEVDGDCVQVSDQDPDGGSDGGSNTDPDLSDDDDFGSGDPDPVVCPEGEVLIWGTCISESEHEGLNSGNTIEETASDAGGGCSLMASQSTGSWARFLLIVPALLGLWLCRSLRRRRCTNCKPARGSTQDRPSPHVCKCSTKCC